MKKTSTLARGALILLSSCIGSGAFAAEIFIPGANDRFPSVTLDPFEQQVMASRPPVIKNKPEAAPAKQTEAETPATANFTDTPPVSLLNPVKREPAYSYSLFLDVDSVNKLSGGAQTAMAMGSEEVSTDATPPPPSTMVYLLHFYGSLSTSKARWWNNGKFVAHIIYGGGESPTGTVGDLRSTSNIDASFMDEQGNMVMPGFDILELWYEHSIPYNKSSFRFGLGYLSSDFYKSKYTGLFLSSGVGSIGTEILWNTMASNPPNTTLGLWYKTSFSDNVYWQIVGFDGFPDHTTRIADVKLDSFEGIFTATELGWQQGSAKKDGYFKLGVGAWYLKQDMTKMMEDTMFMVGYENYTGDPVQGTGGMYVVSDYAVNDNVGVFFKGGIAESGINKYKRYFTSGISYKGLIPSRSGDTAGFAVVQSKLSDEYLNTNGLNDAGELAIYTHETIYEFTYSANINKWLMLQPDLQYVIQPAMNPMNKNAWVGILRAEITIK